MSKLTTQQVQALKDYRKFLKAGISYGESMRIAAQSLRGTPCPTFLAALARVHAAKYQCNYTWDGHGAAVFFDGKESTRETRNEAARKSWERNVMVWFTPERASKPKASHARTVPPAIRRVGMNFLAEFEGDSLAAQVRAAKAALDAILASA